MNNTNLAVIPEPAIIAAIAVLSPYIPDIERDDLLNLSSYKEDVKRPLLKIKEAAWLLGLSRVHVSRLATKGELDRVNVGIDKKLYRIIPESVEEFIARRAGE